MAHEGGGAVCVCVSVCVEWEWRKEFAKHCFFILTCSTFWGGGGEGRRERGWRWARMALVRSVRCDVLRDTSM